MITMANAVDRANARTTMTEISETSQAMSYETDNRLVPLSGALAAKCIESGCPIALLAATALRE